MKNPLISVIVPIYKVESYLDKCVKSIVKQTYRQIEIILVDDGSPDRCPAMCDAWAEKDSRIRVVHKENGGLASARNAGLDIALGDFIGFVDSDDFIDDDMYEMMLKAIFTTKVQIVACGIREIKGNGVINETTGQQTLQLKPDEAIKHLLLWNEEVRSFAWNKLYDRNLVGETRFHEEIKYGEDTPFVYEVLKKSNGYYLLNESKYNYVRRSTSLIGDEFSPKQLQSVEATKLVCKDCKIMFPKLSEEADCHVAMSCLFLFTNLLLTENGKKEYPKEFSYLLKTMRSFSLDLISKHYSRKRSIQWMICRNFPEIYRIEKAIISKIKD